MLNKLRTVSTFYLVFVPALFFVLSFALPLHAQSLEVQFEREPLFGEVNFLPGDVKDGDAQVFNGTEVTQTVYAESVNGFDPDGLGSQMRLVIRNESQIVYDDVFASFLSSGAVPLTELNSGESVTYTFEVSFIDTSDNDYQGKSLGFDLCIGFYGGNLQCSDTVIGEENSGDNNSDGSGGSGYIKLRISDEEAQTFSVSDEGVAVVSWSTNKLSTSRVIYGLASEGPNYPQCLTSGPCYNLDIGDAPNYGYPSSSVQIQNKVTEHNVVIAGLIPGEDYSYRVVSSASPDTVGYEHGFTVVSQQGEIALVNMVDIEEAKSNLITSSSTGALGADITENEEDEDENERILGLALFGLEGDWWIPTLLAIIVVIATWLLLRRKKTQ